MEIMSVAHNCSFAEIQQPFKKVQKEPCKANITAQCQCLCRLLISGSLFLLLIRFIV